MSSKEINPESDAGVTHEGDTASVDEEQVSSQTSSRNGSRVQFSFVPPQDIQAEKISFSTEDGSRGVSVEGIVEYGKQPTLDSINEGRRRSRMGDKRKSSLELRKHVPDSLLLEYGQSAIADDISGSLHARKAQKNRGSFAKSIPGCFHRLFLNPKYPLRRQMMLTFGSVSVLTILLVMIVSIIATIATGNTIKDESQISVEQWVDDIMSTTSRYAAEALSSKIVQDDLVELMYEIARERFAGYPTTDSDDKTPFFDTQSQTNVYPLRGNPLPLDWDVRHTPNEREGNVNANNYAEHVQDRWPWYSANPRLSTAASMYTMQGACDPRSTDSSAMEYYPNCTEANNNITTGGILAPSPTNEQVYRKAADLSPFLKAIFEHSLDIKEFGYYFSNSGAGSSIMFPHYEINSASSYVSVGCEWMRAPNPTDPSLGPIGKDEEIARCHPEGTTVPTREYNPLERGWCRNQALDPSRVHNIGPYNDAWNEGVRLITTGKAIYDSVTGVFVACTLLDFTVDVIADLLEELDAAKLGVTTLVRSDEMGTVVASSKTRLNYTATVDDPVLETGVDQEIFSEIKSTVDYTQSWDPEEVSRVYEETLFETEEHIVSAYPIPSIPEEYDPTYAPEFYVIFSLTKATGLIPIIENVDSRVDENVRSIIVFSLLIGAIGLVIVILLILAIASWFVEPLKWMNKIGDQVVGHFGEEMESGIEYERRKSRTCSPKTELSALAGEFSKTLSRFSGEGTAKRVRSDDNERMNLFDLSTEFDSLYKSRDDSEFGFGYPSDSAAQKGRHLGPNNNNQTPQSKTESSSSLEATTEFKGKAYKSPLFHWMVGAIGLPVLVTTIVISAVVLWQISHQLPSLVVPVKEEYLYRTHSYRSKTTEMLATRATAIAERAARDAHLLTRMATWLFFDAIGVSGSFTEMIEGAEDCKKTAANEACDWAIKEALPCDCAWNDVRGQCTQFAPGESRPLQSLHFVGLREDASSNGSRYSTSFDGKPDDYGYFPNQTWWWDNVTVLPTESATSTRYATTLDRVKVVSALSTVIIPLYNYDKSENKHIGIYLGFEADGMFTGYTGCDYDFAAYPFWRSTEENAAAGFRPELCPLGKYGYDARCRGWYANGRTKAKAGNGILHNSPPYVFIGQDQIIGQSITTALIDPRNNEHIGQTLIDFTPDSIFRSLKSKNLRLSEGGFPIAITPESDSLGHDTVVAPGFSLELGGSAIEDLLKPTDGSFEPIAQNMKAGKSGSGSFSSSIGGGQVFNITYAPVTMRGYHPLNSSDFASGVVEEQSIIYSLALVEAQAAILQPFEDINDSASKTVQVSIGVLTALIAVSVLLIIYIAFRVTTSMTRPVLQLLDVMKGINSMKSCSEDVAMLSDYEGSCREVDSVYKTLEMLYKVVQFANVAFFSGDLEVAYRVLKDALRLFMRLDNKKAIATASNNLGNTMLTIFRTMKANNRDVMFGMSRKDVVEMGTAYFSQSIKLGEDAYDQFYNEQGWSEECLVFMQFLANRYFNRAMFFLTTSADHKNEKEAESLGFRDLQITADMDVEIVDQCVEMGFKINRVERYELMMSRVRGLLALAELGFEPEELFVEDQINDVYKILTNALKNPSHDLFKEISIAGRMQKLDVELIKFFRIAKHDDVNAARAAIRMLVEDEYVYPDAQEEAQKALLTYVTSTRDEHRPDDEDGEIVKELGASIHTLENQYVERVHRKSSFNSSLQKMRSLTKLKAHDSDDEASVDLSSSNREKVNRRSSAMKQSCMGDLTMELF